MKLIQGEAPKKSVINFTENILVYNQHLPCALSGKVLKIFRSDKD